MNGMYSFEKKSGDLLEVDVILWGGWQSVFICCRCLFL